MEPYIRTMGSQGDLMKVEFLRPQREQIRIDHIAYSLSRTCRFVGGMPGWYSTAEHCVLGSRVSSSTKVAREFLIHDAAEFVFGDPPSPVTRVFKEYSEAIHSFQSFLYIHFLGYDRVSAEVNVIDKRICATEQRFLRKSPDEDLRAVPYLAQEVAFYEWHPNKAYKEFMYSFETLFPEYKDVY